MYLNKTIVSAFVIRFNFQFDQHISELYTLRKKEAAVI